VNSEGGIDDFTSDSIGLFRESFSGAFVSWCFMAAFADGVALSGIAPRQQFAHQLHVDIHGP